MRCYNSSSSHYCLICNGKDICHPDVFFERTNEFTEGDDGVSRENAIPLYADNDVTQKAKDYLKNVIGLQKDISSNTIINLVAVWDNDDVYIEYDPNIPDGEVDSYYNGKTSETIKYDSDFVFPEAPHRKNYEFLGWQLISAPRPVGTWVDSACSITDPLKQSNILAENVSPNSQCTSIQKVMNKVRDLCYASSYYANHTEIKTKDTTKIPNNVDALLTEIYDPLYLYLKKYGYSKELQTIDLKLAMKNAICTGFKKTSSKIYLDARNIKIMCNAVVRILTSYCQELEEDQIYVFNESGTIIGYLNAAHDAFCNMNDQVVCRLTTKGTDKLNTAINNNEIMSFDYTFESNKIKLKYFKGGSGSLQTWLNSSTYIQGYSKKTSTPLFYGRENDFGVYQSTDSGVSLEYITLSKYNAGEAFHLGQEHGALGTTNEPIKFVAIWSHDHSNVNFDVDYRVTTSENPSIVVRKGDNFYVSVGNNHNAFTPSGRTNDRQIVLFIPKPINRPVLMNMGAQEVVVTKSEQGKIKTWMMGDNTCNCTWTDKYSGLCNKTLHVNRHNFTLYGDAQEPDIDENKLKSEFNKAINIGGTFVATVKEFGDCNSGLFSDRCIKVKIKESEKPGKPVHVMNDSIKTEKEWSFYYPIGELSGQLELTGYFIDQVGNYKEFVIVPEKTKTINDSGVYGLTTTMVSQTYYKENSRHGNFQGDTLLVKQGEALRLNVRTSGFVKNVRLDFPSDWYIDRDHPLYIYEFEEGTSEDPNSADFKYDRSKLRKIESSHLEYNLGRTDNWNKTIIIITPMGVPTGSKNIKVTARQDAYDITVGDHNNKKPLESDNYFIMTNESIIDNFNTYILYTR